MSEKALKIRQWGKNMGENSEGTGTRVIRRLWDEGWNAGHMEVFQELVHAEFVNHASSYPVPPGPDALRIPAENIRKAFPNLNIRVRRIRELEKDGNIEVFAATVMSGTFDGAGRFMGFSPTGRKIEQQQSHCSRFRMERSLPTKRFEMI